MKRTSAGSLCYRMAPGLQFFLVHPGGPYWRKKDAGVWTIPKGEFENEDPLAAAKREFLEETGISPEGNFISLEEVTQKAGKKIVAWALHFSFDTATLKSNLFEMEWPPGSGKMKSFPEVDKGEWFGSTDARIKINPAQVCLIAQVEKLLAN